MSLAAVASDADGLMIEVHYRPETALCDAEQALLPDAFAHLMRQVRPLRRFMKTELAGESAMDSDADAVN